jgi:predicted membrane protein
VMIIIKNPLNFLSPVNLAKFPFTAVAVGLRSLAILLSAVLALSLIEKMFFVKAIVLLFLGALAELYSIQQVATGMRTTSIQWTLSLSLGGLTFILPIIYYVLRGIIESLHSTLVKGEKPAAPIAPTVSKPVPEKKSDDFWVEQ